MDVDRIPDKAERCLGVQVIGHGNKDSSNTTSVSHSEYIHNSSRGDTHCRVTRAINRVGEHYSESGFDYADSDGRRGERKSGSKSKRKDKKGERMRYKYGDVPGWTTTLKPPQITMEVISLASQLSKIGSDYVQEDFKKFLQTLLTRTSAPSEDWKAVTGGAVLQRCDAMEIGSAVQDFYHMVALIQLAFWIERFLFYYCYYFDICTDKSTVKGMRNTKTLKALLKSMASLGRRFLNGCNREPG